MKNGTEFKSYFFIFCAIIYENSLVALSDVKNACGFCNRGSTAVTKNKLI